MAGPSRETLKTSEVVKAFEPSPPVQQRKTYKSILRWGATPQKVADEHDRSKLLAPSRGRRKRPSISPPHLGLIEGPRDARIMIIGEQPGDEEDQKGRPFVGPAGEVFNFALTKIGLSRKTLYVTNSVKHFKWKPGPPGKPRLHQKPSGSEMHACRPWLEKEIEIVKPKIIVCLGATAATVLFGRAIKLGDEIGKVHRTLPWAPNVLVTYHPSAILRALTNESRESMRSSLEETLKVASDILAELESK